MKRHTRDYPCPVCGGKKEDKKGTGERCWGFTADGEDWVNCTRPEFSGGLAVCGNGESQSYSHKIGGPCKCGVTHLEDNSAASKLKSNAKVTAVLKYAMIDKEGVKIGEHVRVEKEDGSKDFYFKPKGLKSESLPLYGLPKLLKLPANSDVFLVEGEKKCDALAGLGFNVVATCCGGSVTPYKATIEPLKSHRVYLWADNDEPGKAHMDKIAAILGTLGGKPLQIKWEDAPKKGDCADFIDAGGTVDQIRELMKKADIYGLDGWEEPIPFEDIGREDFPVDVLPQWLGDWVNSISKETQTPADLAAMLSLSVIACAVAKKFKIHIRGSWMEPLNLMIAVALPPGERKSAIFSEAIKPLNAFEREHAKEWKLSFQKKQVEFDLAQRRLTAAMKEAEKAAEPNMERINELTTIVANTQKPIMPRIYADDVTVEKLGKMLADQNGKLGIFSDEGGIFSTLAGRYSDGVVSLETFLKGHSGGSFRVDRIARDGDYVNEAALTLGLAVQPGVLSDLGNKKEFMNRGLLARFLYSVPKSKVGYRNIGPTSSEREVRDRFSMRLRLLLGRPERLDSFGEIEPTLIGMSDKASELFMAYERELEKRLRPDADLYLLSGWGNKLMGALARLAGILHLAEHSADPDGLELSPIDDTAILRVLVLGDYLISHVKVAFGIIGNDSTEEAVRILDWLKDKKVTSFSKRDAWRAMRGHIKKAALLDDPLKLLEDLGYIKSVDTQSFKKRGRPQEIFNVYPKLM